MERNQSHRQLSAMKQSFFDQGLLDEQFVQLEELQDDANPNFVEEVVTLYYRDSARLISNIDHALKERNHMDFNKLDNLMHQFKGSSTSIGAKKVKAECNLFREYCRAGNAEGCMKSFQQLKKEYAALRKKLEAYFQEARVRYAGFGKDEDEWVNVKEWVRERSIPLEPSECHKEGHLVLLCFLERDDYALYCDACVVKIRRSIHDNTECRCIFTVRFYHDNSEEVVHCNRLCCRPTQDESRVTLKPVTLNPIGDLWG